MTNGSLIIYDVTTADSGKYTCIAGNSCNIKHHEAFLHVVGKDYRFDGDRAVAFRMQEGDSSVINSASPK